MLEATKAALITDSYCPAGSFWVTLLIFCTKCEGKFVPVAPTRKMLLSMCSVLAWAGGRAGILTDSRQLCQPIRGKLRLCQPMTVCVWEHATSWTTESDNFKKVCIFTVLIKFCSGQHLYLYYCNGMQ